jgi:hypothetical protein
MRFSGELRSFSWTLVLLDIGKTNHPARDHMTIEIQVRSVLQWLSWNVLRSPRYNACNPKVVFLGATTVLPLTFDLITCQPMDGSN